MASFPPTRFLKTFMKAALILGPPTSTTLVPPPTTRATSAAPRPGRTGCCGGGRGIPSTGQVRGAVRSQGWWGGEWSAPRGKVTLIQPDTLLCKERVLDNPKLCTGHPSAGPCASEVMLWGAPPILSLETGLQRPAPDSPSLHHSCPPPHPPLFQWGTGEKPRLPRCLPPTAARHPGRSFPPHPHLPQPGSKPNRGERRVCCHLASICLDR